MGHALVTSDWESGDLVFRRKANKAEIFRLGGGGTVSAASMLAMGIGAAEEVTVDTGVITVTGQFVRITSETGTTDTVTTITKADAADGDMLLCVPVSTDTITFDDGTIDLGDATRAVGPGGHILFLYNGDATSWQELTFLAGSDNS